MTQSCRIVRLLIVVCLKVGSGAQGGRRTTATTIIDGCSSLHAVGNLFSCPYLPFFDTTVTMYHSPIIPPPRESGITTSQSAWALALPYLLGKASPIGWYTTLRIPMQGTDTSEITQDNIPKFLLIVVDVQGRYLLIRYIQFFTKTITQKCPFGCVNEELCIFCQ